jgi:hypothetical protein
VLRIVGSEETPPGSGYIEIAEVQAERDASLESLQRGLRTLLLSFAVILALSVLAGWLVSAHREAAARSVRLGEQARALALDVDRASADEIAVLVLRRDVLRSLAEREEYPRSDREFLHEAADDVTARLARRMLLLMRRPELLEPQAYIRIALLLHRSLENPADQRTLGADVKADAEREVALAAARATEKVLEWGRGGAGFDDLLAAHKMLVPLVEIVPAAERAEYRSAQQQIESRLDQMSERVQAMVEGDSIPDFEGGERTRALYAERTFEALKHAGVGVEAVRSGGERGVRLEIDADRPVQDLADMLLGTDDLRLNLLSLGFLEARAQGTDGTVQLDLLSGRRERQRSSAAQGEPAGSRLSGLGQ